jgi:hypothetical protein
MWRHMATVGHVPAAALPAGELFVVTAAAEAAAARPAAAAATSQATCSQRCLLCFQETESGTQTGAWLEPGYRLLPNRIMQ